MAVLKKGAKRAPKSLHRPENHVFLAVLRDFRERATLTQVQVAERLGRSQNYVSAAERGVVRLDGLQLRDWCQACDSDLVKWAKEVEGRLGGKKATRQSQ
ncbi:helix-turn-helix transcriptional regulator [Rhodanobacter sp. C03]|uniref:helix-turn-helix domain-containing protein n=1 Tax=Rhodanobacter sp. C03 TaxID=1945858 RepID=UPI0009C67C6F|nr:helix-turn-helix transcriptional regulator [Rhodanobacter sp. C03]OOG59927.1 hypothetical protein B0E48_03880 [Rhodanobacter sp. C03]